MMLNFPPLLFCQRGSWKTYGNILGAEATDI